ncbi:efflux RND transporter periplasmic adaptor subunit [Draconibacterium halophilum]|uniref:Efflux RND transporter periplasmic adaptor subunit n=1 Tax=Draconibacterium halophilum TaxID=2706887 RepID=A0A6C0RF57_9BACT|nr:efflux RND transporter periplasmic adaptor subunit [Draconibacterium halophilum]QIA09154.1 efflux RND transporter periplasmic adaptor subunit [Draconibacterium halophilum]
MKRFIILIAVSYLLFACSGSGQKKEAFTKNVKVTTAKKVENISTLSFSGVVKGAHEISVGFKTAGQIQKIYARQGDYVKNGQVLAQLDSSDYKLGLDAYKIQYAHLKKEVARLKAMFDAKTISENDYEKAKAGLEQLEIQVRTYQNKVNYTTLSAPTSGYIQSVNNDPSEMIDAGSPLFSLLDNSKYEVVVDIPAKQYVEKELFKGYFITSKFIGDQKLPLNLISISPKADVNQLYQMRFIIEDINSKITAGMNVELHIEKENVTNVGKYTITPHAVLSKAEKTYVWIYSNGKVTSKEVAVYGIDENGDLSISGISTDDKIVRAGVNSLHENEAVVLLNDANKTNIGGLL